NSKKQTFPFTTYEIITRCIDLKEKKEVVEEAAEAAKENGSEDAPANGNGTVSTNGASHKEEKTHEDEEGGDDDEEGESDVAFEAVKTKKQKTEENGDSTEAEVQA
uniref:Uncharacterized protein n=1 Tax=Cyprinus carpio TaxID=7962 RepID=A0A8C1SJT7_CYPCA